MVVQFAKAASLRVIGVDVGQDRADKVLESGAEFYFDATDSDLAEKVGKVTNGGAHAVSISHDSSSQCTGDRDGWLGTRVRRRAASPPQPRRHRRPGAP